MRLVVMMVSWSRSEGSIVLGIGPVTVRGTVVLGHGHGRLAAVIPNGVLYPGKGVLELLACIVRPRAAAEGLEEGLEGRDRDDESIT